MLPIIFLIIAVACVFAFFAAYLLLFRSRFPVADVEERETSRLSYPRRRFPMEKKDALPLIIITVVYAVVAFWGLGDRTAPTSFCTFSGEGQYAVVELPAETLISKVMYYSGLFNGNYFLQYSDDGENYTDAAVLEQKHSGVLKWHEQSLADVQKAAKYIRIISDSKLQMGELCLYDWAGDLIPTEGFVYDDACAGLFDERGLVPDSPSYLNGAYFDEIYHARTATEHIVGIYPYEVSHPPLGKLIIGLGIRAFGLNPFGWRFMGVLFGVLMLPFLYVFIKNLFGSTAISACGTAIFAFDFMHYVQTRIATIDTYGVFFILLMYFFMYRYITVPRDDPFTPKWKETLPLFLSGLSLGLGCASKWTAVYGGAGLALIWLLFRIARGRELCSTGHTGEHRIELVTNILQCAAFFVLIPAAIYYVSYWYYGTARGLHGDVSMLFSKEYAQIVLENQKFMFTYHAGVTATHPYSSRWYQWIVDGRPILYYLESLPDNYKSAFAAFMNPLVCWGGLLAIISMAWRTIRYHDGKALFILIGYLASLVPWMFISRITFEYHYFPCLIFLVLALCHVFNSFRLRDRHWKPKVYGAAGACILLFVLFYPVLSGIPAPRWYTDLLAWIPDAWPL
ncbi:MAG: phospholipid carrier-dependent glycosyltransferase [Clostridiales bacterium]|nr:phospholipid carrier-dependent glycosyltransferase [Clostridiales bacterium]